MLERGWVHALSNLGERRPRGEEMLARFVDALVDGSGDTEARFEAGASPASGAFGRVPPFHPAPVLRAHVERRLSFDEPERERLASIIGARLRVAIAPHPSCLAPDEARVVALLATASGRPGAELTAIAGRERLLRLLAFLDAIGLLSVEDPAIAEAWAALGLAAGAAPDEVRRAYHRLARTLHPDAHPDAPLDERRDLEARFDAATRAYRLLVGDRG